MSDVTRRDVMKTAAAIAAAPRQIISGAIRQVEGSDILPDSIIKPWLERKTRLLVSDGFGLAGHKLLSVNIGEYAAKDSSLGMCKDGYLTVESALEKKGRVTKASCYISRRLVHEAIIGSDSFAAPCVHRFFRQYAHWWMHHCGDGLVADKLFPDQADNSRIFRVYQPSPINQDIAAWENEGGSYL